MRWNEIKRGIVGGFAGGLVFGVMMAMMGMLPMIGSMVGVPSAWAGFAIHLVISAVIGGAFGIALDITRLPGGLATGATYGALWWILGPLTLMPLFMGMGLGVNWNAAGITQALPSLVGHVMFGLVLGATYQWLPHRHPHHATPHARAA